MRNTLAAALVLLTAAACADDATAPARPASPSLSSAISPAGDEIIDGSTGPGSVYRLVRPANWNGQLVVYSHGYAFPDQPVGLPAEGSLIVGLLAPQGFGVAFSSYSENGWVVRDGAQRTHQLLGLFASKFGQPTRVYAAGASMGGLIAIKLTETYPTTYAGVLAVCPVAAGTRAQFDYAAHVRALFDVFYPGVLPGDAASLPPGTDVDAQIIAPALAAMTANPTPAFYIAAIAQTPVPFATPAELVQSILMALGSHAGDVADVELTKGKPYFDNRSTIYSSAVLPAPLLQVVNASVGRFSASPAALASFDHSYTPSGDLRVPMLMLANARDPVVPWFHETSYLAAVTANGASNLLVQRAVPGYGHCVFSPTDLLTAFTDLVLWVQYGIEPAP